MEFQQLQKQLAAAIRQPDIEPPTGVSADQLSVYRELMFNNICSFVNQAFPVLRSLYDDEVWRQKIADFFQHSWLESPYFLHIAEEFLQWHSEQPLTPDDPPFVYELAHYEWVELELSTRVGCLGEPLSEISAETKLQLSDLAEVFTYQFPVMQISAQYQPQGPSAQPHSVLVYRNEQDEVKFVELNSISAITLYLLKISPGLTTSELLQQLAEQCPQLEPSQLSQGATEFIQQMQNKAVIRAFQDS